MFVIALSNHKLSTWSNFNGAGSRHTPCPMAEEKYKFGAWVRLASAAALLAACALWHARQVADARDEEARHERGTALVEREERRERRQRRRCRQSR